MAWGRYTLVRLEFPLTHGNGTNRVSARHRYRKSSSKGKGMTDESGTVDSNDLAGSVRDAVQAIEDAAVATVEAAIASGDIEAAQRVGAGVVEQLRRALADIEGAAETVEAVAEEIAEDAPEGAPAEAAEEAVEAAHEAIEAVDEAEAEVREEQREQGGGEVTESVAVDEAIHEEAEEVKEELPIEDAPAVAAEEEFTQEIADIVAEPEPTTAPPTLIAPETSHPYFKKRSIKVFGKTINM